jgi:hypothetical protein
VPRTLGEGLNALGKKNSKKNRSTKMSLPSAFYQALGKAFTEYPTLGKA